MAFSEKAQKGQRQGPCEAVQKALKGCCFQRSDILKDPQPIKNEIG